MSKETNSILLTISIVLSVAFISFTIGHIGGARQSGGLEKLARANEKVAASYDRLSEQLARIKSLPNPQRTAP